MTGTSQVASASGVLSVRTECLIRNKPCWHLIWSVCCVLSGESQNTSHTHTHKASMRSTANRVLAAMRNDRTAFFFVCLFFYLWKLLTGRWGWSCLRSAAPQPEGPQSCPLAAEFNLIRPGIFSFRCSEKAFSICPDGLKSVSAWKQEAGEQTHKYGSPAPPWKPSLSAVGAARADGWWWSRTIRWSLFSGLLDAFRFFRFFGVCFLKACWFHRRRFLTQAELFGWSLFCSGFSALLNTFSLAGTLRLFYFLVLFGINCPPKNQDRADLVLEVDLKLVSDYWSKRDDVQMSSLLRTEMKPMRTRGQGLTVDILEYKPKNTTASHSSTLPSIVFCFCPEYLQFWSSVQTKTAVIITSWYKRPV